MLQAVAGLLQHTHILLYFIISFHFIILFYFILLHKNPALQNKIDVSFIAHETTL